MSTPSRSPGGLELVVYTGASPPAVHALPRQGFLRIGRDEGNDVRIESQSVSRKHAILHVGPPLRIEDVGSKSGTFVLEPPVPVAGGRTNEPRRLTRQTANVDVGDCINLGSVLVVVRRASAPSEPPAPVSTGNPRVARDPAMRALYDLAGKAAEGRIPVLILGNNGVGKDVMAAWIHAHSRRAKRPFVAINCGALPAGLAEAELFGTEKGIYNDAPSRAGLLETADGGTVFLDEVGELPLPIQVKLLRVIEDGKVTRLGGRTPRTLDLRFIAATNKPIAEAIRDREFREDFFYRLNGIKLVIPPLRERTAEIAPLADLFAQKASRQLERERVPAISPEALAMLEGHSWPGNVRELRQAMDRAVLLCGHGEEILPEHLPPEMARPPESHRTDVVKSSDRPTTPPVFGKGDRRKEHEEEGKRIEREAILAALERCSYNQTRAADELGWSRRKLLYKMKEHGIDGPRVRRGGAESEER